MKFVDEARIKVQAGNGGRGCVSFRREKFVPFGGPDGGDGGQGGSVTCARAKASTRWRTSASSAPYKAKSGEGGSGNDCSGRGGEDLLRHGPGRHHRARRARPAKCSATCAKAAMELLVAAGGKGGCGNTRFKSSTNRAPRQFGPGLPGEKRELELELKVHRGRGPARPAECRASRR